MTNDHTNKHGDLHLHDDPELAQTESLLDLMGKQDRDSMPIGLESRVLDAISKTIAPAPLTIAQASTTNTTSRFWSLRYAAAAVLATGTTLVIVGTQPWASPIGNTQPAIALVSLVESDLDAFFALESMDDGNLAEAVTDWEFWAQSVDTEIDSSLSGYDWGDFTSDDGAL